ncbi:hypothetical protein EX30DRAFT_399187 [Ascodesmis nigricans]|uniref:Uncharacterized protein n=1 Tax=Ascodesmis nigricans TaxID=341454 RepID=A0A4S2MMX7_9PEZI|nr:hypothetical protein EX30DRAFT_399187 [Ascodesmis nigricans]
MPSHLPNPLFSPTAAARLLPRPVSRRSRNRHTAEVYASSPSHRSHCSHSSELDDDDDDDDFNSDPIGEPTSEHVYSDEPIAEHVYSDDSLPPHYGDHDKEEHGDDEGYGEYDHTFYGSSHDGDDEASSSPWNSSDPASEVSSMGSMVTHYGPEYGRSRSVRSISRAGGSVVSCGMEVGRGRVGVRALRRIVGGFEDDEDEDETDSEESMISTTAGAMMIYQHQQHQQQSSYNPAGYYLRHRPPVRYTDSSSPVSNPSHASSSSSKRSFTALQSRQITDRVRSRSITFYSHRASSSSPIAASNGRLSSLSHHPRPQSSLSTRSSYPPSPDAWSHEPRSTAIKLMPIKPLPLSPFTLTYLFLRTLLLLLFAATFLTLLFTTYCNRRALHMDTHVFKPTLHATITLTLHLSSLRDLLVSSSGGDHNNEAIETCIRDLGWLLRQVAVQAIMTRQLTHYTLAREWMGTLPRGWNAWEKPETVEMSGVRGKRYGLDLMAGDGGRCWEVLGREARYVGSEAEEAVEMLRRGWGLGEGGWGREWEAGRGEGGWEEVEAMAGRFFGEVAERLRGSTVSEESGDVRTQMVGGAAKGEDGVVRGGESVRLWDGKRGRWGVEEASDSEDDEGY